MQQTMSPEVKWVDWREAKTIDGFDREYHSVVLVAVAVLESEAKAKEALKSKVDEWEILPEAKFTKTALKDIGDECYVIMDKDGTVSRIFFRQGVYHVNAFGPTLEIAKRFAHDVSSSLPAAFAKRTSLPKSDGSDTTMMTASCRRPMDNEMAKGQGKIMLSFMNEFHSKGSHYGIFV